MVSRAIPHLPERGVSDGCGIQEETWLHLPTGKVLGFGVWFWVLPLQKQQLLSSAELGAESWVRLLFTRCQSLWTCSPACPPKQPCLTSPAMLAVPQLIGFFAVPFSVKCFYVIIES